MPEEVSTKQCSKCKEIKPRTEFHQNWCNADGLNRVCKSCNTAHVRAYYYSEDGRKKIKEYYQLDRVKKRRVENQRAYCERNKLKHKARQMFEYAVRSGRIARPDRCSKCGVECKPDGHHYLGYEEEHWYDVQWLCEKCHGETF